MNSLEETMFGIYVPSYKRAHTATTHRFLEYCTYVVRKSEEEAYRNAGIQNLLAVDDKKICGLTEVNQWLIDNAPEDVIAILDDDIHHFYYRLETNRSIEDPVLITSELERIAQLLVDLQIGFAATDATTRPFSYDAEFAFKGSAGAVRWINRPVFKARCVKELEYNYDLDLVLQELLINRVILKPKYFCSKGLTDVNDGGASSKDRGDQVASVELMKAKWGKYFGYNYKNNTPYIYVPR